MRYLLCLLLAITFVSNLHAQIPGAIQVGNSFTKDEVDRARSLLDAVKPSVFQWNVGNYEIFQKGSKAQGELTWEISDETIVEIREIPANTLYEIEAVRAGSTATTFSSFAPQKDSYWRFRAIAPGTTSISIWGTDGKKAIRIAKMQITVQGSNPKPPVDPTDVLVMAARKDIANGNGKLSQVDDFAFLCATFAKQLTDGKEFKNVGDFTNYIQNAGEAMLGDKAKVLPLLRRAVGDEINSKLTRDPAADVSKQYRETASLLLNSISQRLQGVK